MKAVIPAAGLGTRFLPATKNTPKEMLPIVDKPTIQYVVEEAAASGADDVLIVTGRGKRAIEDYFDASPELEARLEGTGRGKLLDELHDLLERVDIHYVRQREPRGLADAVLAARKHVGGEAFAVLLGDDVTLPGPSGWCTERLWEAHEAHDGAAVIAVEEVPVERLHRYGVIAHEGEVAPGVLRVSGLVEKPADEAAAPSRLASIGRYVFPASFFEDCAAIAPGLGGELQLADAMVRHLGRLDLLAWVHDGERFDTGSRLEWLKSNVTLALRRGDLGAELRGFLQGALDDPDA